MKGRNTLVLLTAVITVDAYVSRQASSGVRLPPSARTHRYPMTMQIGQTNSGFNHHRTGTSPVKFLHSNKLRKLAPTGTQTQLAAKKDEPEEEDEKDGSTPGVSNKIVTLWKVLLTKMMNFFPTLRVALASFTVGAIFALTLVFVPVYNSVDKMSEPVTLFETILSDLSTGYVDEIDSKKLFETGISAMLKSLDPYTEFEGRQEAQDMNESIKGTYGGIGLVISGSTIQKPVPVASVSNEGSGTSAEGSKILPKEALKENAQLLDNDTIALDDDDDEDLLGGESGRARRKEDQKAYEKAVAKGIRVVNAFEGYAFDYGMRPGDKLVGIDGSAIDPGASVEDVRNRLRGDPGSSVDITFEREGVEGQNTITIKRTVVQIADVKLATMVGDPKDGIGYIQLSTFTQDAGREMRNAIFALQQASEDASNGNQSLQGLILDLRGNPGGLLTSAVDVTSLLVPKGSDIVSARGRGFPGVTYKSRVDPILNPKTKLAVLINDSTASAAEIVSGAVQDLDVGVIVGSGRTYGKGLVQNVETLPFNTALKFTVAKYYTPSGRCIQSTNYSNGAGLGTDGKYKSSKVAEKDKKIFFTTNGREVKDGGGVAVDYKIETPKASALEVTLIRSNVVSEFAAEWSKTHELTNNFAVDDNLYREFQSYVMKQAKSGDLKLDALYSSPINDLKKSLERSGYKGSTKELEQLQASIMQDMTKDFDKYKSDIKEDVAIGILQRYLPESMLIDRSIQTDKQVLGALKIFGNQSQFNKLLARNSENKVQEKSGVLAESNINPNTDTPGAKMSMKF